MVRSGHFQDAEEVLDDRVPAAAPARGVEVRRIERDAHEPARRGYGADLVVGYVPGMGAARLGRRVANDHGPAGDLEDVPERAGCGVGEVDQHAAALHLGDDVPSQRREPAGNRVGSRRVPELVGVHPREREVPRAERAEARHVGGITLQRLAVLDPREERDPAAGRRRPDLACRGGERASVGASARCLADRRDQRLRAGARAAVREGGIDPGGQEDGVHAAFGEAGEIGVARLPPHPEIDPVVDHAEGSVHVAVEDDRAPVHSAVRDGGQRHDRGDPDAVGDQVLEREGLAASPVTRLLADRRGERHADPGQPSVRRFPVQLEGAGVPRSGRPACGEGVDGLVRPKPAVPGSLRGAGYGNRQRADRVGDT